MPSTFKAMKIHKDNSVHICPKCGNERATQVSRNNYYCIKCDIEFDDSGKVYMIMFDGTLVDYQVNEFAELY